MNQSKNNVPSINQKPIQIAPVPFLIGMISFSLWLVSLFRELSLFAVYPPPCHSARSRGRSRRIHHPSNYPRPPGEGGLLQTVGECRGRALSPKLLIALTGTELQGEGFFRFLKCGFCNSGQALRAEWHESEVEIRRKTQFIKVWSYKRQDKNRFCWIINTWINQKTMYPSAIKNPYT